MTVFSGIAEFEHELIKERTSAGRMSARKRGVKFVRSHQLSNEQKKLALRLLGEDNSVRQSPIPLVSM